MIINGFIWDDTNTQHIAWHEVAPSEVDEILNHPWAARATHKKIRLAIFGVTDGERHLVVIIEPRDNEYYYPITAFDMSYTDKDFYNKEVSKL